MPSTSMRPLWTRAIVIGVAMVLLDLPLRTAAAPNGILSYELAWTGARAEAMIASWTGGARVSAWGSLLLDYGFMVAYASLLAALARRAFTSGAGRLLAGAAWAGAAFDAGENLALIRMVGWGATDQAARIAAVFASVKFALLGVVVVAVAGLALRRRLAG
jgi:hypothetical protein